MQWLQFIQILLKYGPEVYSVVSEIISLVEQLSSKSEQLFTRKHLETCYRVYRTTGNRQPLRALRDDLHKRVFTAVVKG